MCVSTHHLSGVLNFFRGGVYERLDVRPQQVINRSSLWKSKRPCHPQSCASRHRHLRPLSRQCDGPGALLFLVISSSPAVPITNQPSPLTIRESSICTIPDGSGQVPADQGGVKRIGWRLTTLASGRKVRVIPNAVFAKAPGSIWKILGKLLRCTRTR